MYSHINLMGQHRLLDFLHKQPLAAHLGQRYIQNPVAFGNNLMHLKSKPKPMLPAQPLQICDHLPRLRERQRTLSAAYNNLPHPSPLLGTFPGPTWLK
ncbi:hypothetical protein D3C73_870490 [compost metagenome]